MTGHCEHCRQDCWGDEDGFHSNTGETVQWDAGYCPNCAERAAIVAWLRKWAGDIGYLVRFRRGDYRHLHAPNVLAWMIDYIERGEHLRGDDE